MNGENQEDLADFATGAALLALLARRRSAVEHSSKCGVRKRAPQCRRRPAQVEVTVPGLDFLPECSAPEIADPLDA